MSDEIKEILDRLFVYKNENDEMKYQPEDILTIDDVWLLLDYITNLQEENNRLNNIIKELTQENLKRSDKIDELLEIKNKAIDYIEEKGRLKYKPDELINILQASKPRKTRLQELKGDSSNE